MSAPPVIRCAGWEELIAASAAHPELAGLAGIDRDLAQAVLAAPAAIALWIAQRAPRLAARDRLRLLVIGAETVDAVDQGRWYAAIPRLLDAGCEAAVTLVGAELDPSFASPAAALAPPRPARCVRSRLDEFLGAGGSAFDLAVMFHPGLGKHRGWLEDGSCARLIAGGTQLVATAYEVDEYEMDRWVVESYGYGVEGDPVINPFFLDLDHERTQVRWGRALWGFSSSVPAPGYVADHGRLAALDTLTRMVMHSMTRVGTPGPAPGARVELAAQSGGRLALIHVFDHRFVDPASGKLLHLTAQGTLESCGKLAGGELNAYPGPGARPLEQALWAAGIKSAYLLPTYPPAVNAAAAQDKARDLCAILRERAARLFKR